MLINCPECNGTVSDKASSCPHCGYPLQNISPRKASTPSRKREHKRLPNGFGQITKISGENLRKPYRVMVSVGKTPEGKPISKLLRPEAYFSSYNEAYSALLKYNENPYDLSDDLTVMELYSRWIEAYSKTLKSNSSLRTIKSAWAYCNAVYDLRAVEIRPRHIKMCMDATESANIKRRIKSVFNLMYDYATEFELVSTNPARQFNVDKNIRPDVKEHISFSDDEMNLLWQNTDNELVCWILFQCYTGWRPQEMLNIRLKDIDMDSRTIVGGMKTTAGTNRTVPICQKILPVAKKIKSLSELRNSEFLISDEDGNRILYRKYNRMFGNLRDSLGLDTDHRPHDPRKQFVTMCKKYNVDEYAVKRIVGHAIEDITEKIYTDRNISWLVSEADKLQ